MGIKGLFFNGLFAVCCLLALAEPFAGIVAYVVHYHTAPERAWWGASLSAAGVRYSYTISLFLALGTLLNLKRLPFGRAVTGQEVLFLTFLAWMVCGRLLNGQLTAEDSVDKMLKLAVFLLALTHIVVTPKRFDQFFWLLVLCSLYVGREAYNAPASYYNKGRLEGIGGPDFSDSNMFGAHMAAMLPPIGIQFLRSGWRGKLVCFLAGGFAANAVVLTRSRGAFLGLAAGLIAALLLKPKGRSKMVWGLAALALVGGLALTDAGYWERMDTLKAEEEDRDASAQDRLISWEAGLKMAMDNPLGVGPGNFHAHMGQYIPRLAGRDPHNTYVRCVAELGWPGFALFAAMIANAFMILARARRTAAGRPGGEDCIWYAFALQVSMVTYLAAVIFVSTIYIEMMWWLIMLSVALERSVANPATGPHPG